MTDSKFTCRYGCDKTWKSSSAEYKHYNKEHKEQYQEDKKNNVYKRGRKSKKEESIDDIGITEEPINLGTVNDITEELKSMIVDKGDKKNKKEDTIKELEKREKELLMELEKEEKKITEKSQKEKELIEKREELKQLYIQCPDLVNLKNDKEELKKYKSIDNMDIEELKLKIGGVKRELNKQMDMRFVDGALSLANQVIGGMLGCVEELEERVNKDIELKNTTKNILGVRVLNYIPMELKGLFLYSSNVAGACKDKQMKQYKELENELEEEKSE
jgi:hypothetical protein